MKNTMHTSTNEALPSYLTVRQFSEKHDWPVGGLRHLIFYRPNGFAKVVKRVGRKVLLDERAFLKWIDESGSNGSEVA